MLKSRNAAISDESKEEVIFNEFEAYLNIGKHLLKRKIYERALPYLTIAQKLEEKNIQCMLLRATCYLYMTKFELALREGEKAYSYNKKSPHALLLIAEAYYQQGEFESALTKFELGRRKRPSISAFQIGVYKCEQAIWNNCDGDFHIKLARNTELTDYYLNAFPIKSETDFANTSTTRGNDKSGRNAKWPIQMRAANLNRLLGKEYPDYVYIREVYDIEGKRETFLRQTGSTPKSDVLPRLKLGADSRNLAIECARCIGRKCDLWYKMDPSFRHQRRLS